MKLDPRQTKALALGAAGLAVVFGAFRFYTLDANLKASAGITQKLKSDLERLETENKTMREEAQARQAESGKMAQELESARARDTASGRRNEELEKLVTDAEKSLGLQNGRIAELELKLGEAEGRLKRQRERSEELGGAARDAQTGRGANADYAKLMESEWLAAIARTEALQKELEEASMELADGNAARARMQKEVATMHYNLAVILTGEGKLEAAVREYERVLQIRPGDPDAHYNLAVLYDTELKDRGKALEHYRLFLEAAPQSDEAGKVRLWIKEKEFETRLQHPSILPNEEKRF